MKILYTLLLSAIVLSVQAAECGPGGVQCASGTCHYPTYIEGCYIYASSSSCQQCEYNYIKTGNICTYSPPVDYSDCCKKYSLPSGTCSQCSKGLSLLNGKCIEKKIVGCLQKSSTGNCLNCAIEYFLFGGQCFKKISGCKKYSATGSCQQCEQQKFYFLNGICIPKLFTSQNCKYPWVPSEKGCIIPGCTSVGQYGCNICQNEFRLSSDGSCKFGSINGCQSYNSDGLCKLCKQPYYVKSEGYCLPYGCLEVNPEGSCLRCDKINRFEMVSDGFCKMKNCLVSIYNQCVLCQKGFVEVRGSCQKQQQKKICTICAKNFYLTVDGTCKRRQLGCSQYSNYKCSACQQNLYLNKNNQCVKKQLGCLYQDGFCSQCIAPFKWSPNYTCKIEGCSEYIQSGCKTCLKPYILSVNGFCTFQNCYEVQYGRCLRCIEGYTTANEGYCFKVDEYCKAYSFDGKCIECKLGYFWDKLNSKCQQEKIGCNYVDGKCVSCRAPFQYIPKEESCEIDGCVKYFIGGCSSCRANYDLRYNSCKLPYCLIPHNGHCVECDPGYILKSDGICVNRDQFCWKYDSKGSCIECSPNYYFSKISQKCKQKQAGCLYNEKDECYKCQSPFYFDGIRCQIYGCMKLGSKGCDQCFYPMYLDKNGLCKVVNCEKMIDSKCQICKEGYFLASDGSCQRKDTNCIDYDENKCKKCIKGYRLDRYGLCQYSDQHCWDFSSKGSCTNCDRLYFLNKFHQCEVKDSNCAAYSEGRCIQCRDYFYLHRGLCYPNAKGCLKQISIKQCLRCEKGYKIDNQLCIPEITRLGWDSVNMDFWSGESDEDVKTSKQIFSIGKTNKLNLDGAIIKGRGKIIFSSVIKNRKSFQVDDFTDSNGWSPEGQNKQFLGVLLEKMEVFYALDIKYIEGNTLKKFAIQQSDDGKFFSRVGEFQVGKNIPGTVQTYYFTPVHSRAIRILVLEGTPNIKFQFYFSNGQNKYLSEKKTYIQEQTQNIIEDRVKVSLFEAGQSCVEKELCWMGLELCEAKNINGFDLKSKADSNGNIDAVFIKYSQDGVNFRCYNECKQLSVTSRSLTLSPTILASKLRIYPSKWTGRPSYTISFDY